MDPIAILLNDLSTGHENIWTIVRRSEGARLLRAKPREALPLVTQLLEAQRPTEEPAGLQEQIYEGLAVLLADLGREMKVATPKHLVFTSRHDWLTWARDLCWWLVWNDPGRPRVQVVDRRYPTQLAKWQALWS